MNNLEDKYEHCIICKQKLNVLKTTPVEKREYYIFGAGQMCAKCFNKFKKSLKEKGKNKVLDLEYKYSLKDFINANSFNQCFDDRNIINDDEYYTINLSKPNGCMFNTNYIINIITSNDVVENNASEIKGNKYIWYVENDNKDNFKLNIKIKKGTEKTFKDKYNYISYMIVGIALLGIIVAIIILIKKNKNSKKI